jgi:hypothetical protein
MYGDRRYDLPLMSGRACLFARMPLACMAGMSHDITVHPQPRRCALQFSLQSRPSIGFTGKAPMREMPKFSLPTSPSCRDLPLQARLRALLTRLGAHDEPPFGSLRYVHDSAVLLHAAILSYLPLLTALLQHRFRFF